MKTNDIIAHLIENFVFNKVSLNEYDNTKFEPISNIETYLKRSVEEKKEIEMSLVPSYILDKYFGGAFSSLQTS